MAPLSKALTVEKISESTDDGTSKSVWGGTIDSDWTVANVPNGGYCIGLILEACAGHQGIYAPHALDPIHITVHFLRSGIVFEKDEESKKQKPATFEVAIKTIKFGTATTNLHAEIIQKEKTSVMAHAIFGAILDDSEPPKYLSPPSTYARKIPNRTLPCQSIENKLPALSKFWNFMKHFESTKDPILLKLNEPEFRKAEATNSDPQALVREPPGIEFAGWMELTAPGEVWRPSMLPWAMDIMTPFTVLLPPEVNPLAGQLWYPTLTMSIEFKFPIRHVADMKNMIGMYSYGSHLQEPLGRYNHTIEVWTAPPADQDPNDHSWREKQKCLAVSSQTSFSLPFESQKASKM